MFRKGIFNQRSALLVGLFFSVAVSPIAASQSNSFIDHEVEPADVPEEIVVYGQKNIIQLRAEIYRAEEAFLDKFNLLNSHSDFDFKCKFITLLENRARKRVCVPRFAQKYEARMAAAMVRDGNFQTPPRYRAQLRKKETALVAEMLTLVGENEELREAQSKLDQAKVAYASELKERREDKAEER